MRQETMLSELRLGESMGVSENETRGLTAGLVILIVCSLTAGLQSSSWLVFAEVLGVGAVAFVVVGGGMWLLNRSKDKRSKNGLE